LPCASPDQVILSSRTFRTFEVNPDGQGGSPLPKFLRRSSSFWKSAESRQVPVEMDVLSSQPFSSQSGIVDATESGNIPAGLA